MGQKAAEEKGVKHIQVTGMTSVASPKLTLVVAQRSIRKMLQFMETVSTTDTEEEFEFSYQEHIRHPVTHI